MSVDVIQNPIAIPAYGLELRSTASPIVWAKGRWPDIAWVDGEVRWCRRDADGVNLVRVRHAGADTLVVEGFASQEEAETWLRKHLGWMQVPPVIADPVVAHWLSLHPGLRPYTNGSLADGVIFAILGQNISLHALAAVQSRISAVFSSPLTVDGRDYYPFPSIELLAETTPAQLRACGTTWKKAEAIVTIANISRDGGLISDDDAIASPDEALKALRALPLVGPWTAAATLLWGLGLPDAHVTGDVALLRAARAAYGRPEMTLKELDVLAETWRPARAWAARALWISLFGAAE